MHPQQNQRPALSWQEGVNVAWVFGLCAATVVAPFVHRDFGRRALAGMNVLGALVLIALCGTAGPPKVMAAYFWCWLAALAVRRVQTLLSARRGAVIHSFWMGDPELERWLPPAVARWLEVLLLAGGGLLLRPKAPGLAAVLVLGAVGLATVGVVTRAVRERRRERMRDAMIEGSVFEEGEP